MKKLLIGITVLVVLVFCSVYFFIPRKLIIIEEIKPACSINCVQRMTGISNYRKKWLPEDTKIISPTAFIFDGCTFSFAPDAFYNNNVKIKYKKINVNSMLFAEASGNDTFVNWEFNLQSSNNPFTRLSDYLDAKHIKIAMNKMLQNLLVFLKSKQNVYGFDIQKTTLADSTLIALKAFTDHYPTVYDIYANIEKIRQYATANGAIATNKPMLNIKKEDTGSWYFMVAIPVNKFLPGNGSLITKRMLSGGNFLETANIKGGFTKIDLSIKELENFRTDYNYVSPAIPFQSLVTDRTKEPDSSKWITKLYYPVF